MSALDNPQVDISLEVFLRNVRPRLKTLFVHYGIPPQDTEDLLQQALLALIYQRHVVRDPESWLIGTLRNKCLLYWREHRRKLYEVVDAAVLELMAEPIPPAQETTDIRVTLQTRSSSSPSAAVPSCLCATRVLSRSRSPNGSATARPASARSPAGASPLSHADFSPQSSLRRKTVRERSERLNTSHVRTPRNR